MLLLIRGVLHFGVAKSFTSKKELSRTVTSLRLIFLFKKIFGWNTSEASLETPEEPLNYPQNNQ